MRQHTNLAVFGNEKVGLLKKSQAVTIVLPMNTCSLLTGLTIRWAFNTVGRLLAGMVEHKGYTLARPMLWSRYIFTFMITCADLDPSSAIW